MSIRRAIGLGALLLAFLAGTARAHENPYSYLDVDADGSMPLRGRIAVHPVDLARAAGFALPESLEQAAFLARHAEGLRAAAAARLDLRRDGARLACACGHPAFDPEGGLVALPWEAAGEAPSAAGALLEIRGPLFGDEEAHMTFLTVRDGGRTALQGLLDRGHPAASVRVGSVEPLRRLALRFAGEGFRHVVSGLDHVLFVIGLLLAGGGLLRLLKIVSAFTAAHSITLALAVLGLVRPPGSLIEPAIAMSIVWVGIENLRLRSGTAGPSARPHPRRAGDPRTLLSFAFGLAHGFGFAGALTGGLLPPDRVAASLLSFNAGVEGAQACIVLLVAPALGLLRSRRPRIARPVVVAGSLAVAAAGGYWLVERLLG